MASFLAFYLFFAPPLAITPIEQIYPVYSDTINKAIATGKALAPTLVGCGFLAGIIKALRR